MYFKNLLDYFEETVRRYPQKTALIHGEDALSFEALHSDAQQLADYIMEMTAGCDKRSICIFLPKSVGVAIGDIAALYSGNFFNNLDIKTPADRIRNIFHMLQPAAVITNDKYLPVLEKFSDIDFPIINLDGVEWKKDCGHNAELAARREQQSDMGPLSTEEYHYRNATAVQ